MSMSSVDTADRPPIALVDLGDTLAECTPAVRAALARLRLRGEPEGDDALIPLPAYLEERRRAVMSEPGFWRTLAPRPAGFKLLTLLRDAGFRVHVLTKGPRDAPQAWADKVAWCRVHLPDVLVTVTDDKSVVHGAVLVDDWVPYVDRWQHRWPNGLAIVPAQPWNAECAVGPRRLRDDGRTPNTIAKALRDCRTRLRLLT